MAGHACSPLQKAHGAAGVSGTPTERGQAHTPFKRASCSIIAGRARRGPEGARRFPDRATLTVWSSSTSRPTDPPTRRRHRFRGTSWSTAPSRSARRPASCSPVTHPKSSRPTCRGTRRCRRAAVARLGREGQGERRTDPRLKGLRGRPWGDRRGPRRSGRHVVDAARRRQVDRERRPRSDVLKRSQPVDWPQAFPR